MNFKTHNDNIPWAGGSLQGYITITYAKLVEIFGEPSGNHDDYKCDAEWDILFENGTSACIYNWKNGRNYCGSEGQDTEDITDWNIGGEEKLAPILVNQAVVLHVPTIEPPKPVEVPTITMAGDVKKQSESMAVAITMAYELLEKGMIQGAKNVLSNCIKFNSNKLG